MIPFILLLKLPILLRCIWASRYSFFKPDVKESGAAGVIRKGSGVQVVYGPQVAVIKSEVEEYLREV